MQLNNTHILKDINNADESQKHYAENKNPDQKKKNKYMHFYSMAIKFLQG